ncbi:hypothetical protein MLD38_006421 [Melastoma candidum]|uniref:Uncharacterized protein n=1 Tax=Melastoma candidum TaxID=119954 RepID=A0ACB9RMG2_9MYRT|nr:hypothetical protein MLD38_006421 [Melastoma candidum]
MGRAPRSSVCAGVVLNKGAWTASEDKLLLDYVKIHGEGRWSRLSRETGLKRCGKSCRLRWMNYLRPDIKRGNISADEEELIIRLHKLLGNRWSLIAGRLPGRTDNEIKNYWNTNIVKKKPELLLPRLVTLRDTPRNSDPYPKGNDDFWPRQLEQPDIAIPDEAQQGNGLIRSNNPELALMKQIMLPDSDNLSDGSLSLVSPSEDNPSNFMISFSVDDICQILDADFTGLEDVNLSNKDSLGIDCFLDNCKLAIPAGNEGSLFGLEDGHANVKWGEGRNE